MNSSIADYIHDVQFNQSIFQAIGELFRKNNHEGTWLHCIKVAQEAKQLAVRFGYSPEAAELAGWLHDIGTIIPNEEKIAVAQSYGVEVLEGEARFPYILHQKISKAMSQDIFQISDNELLNAIACHTTLRPNSSLLDKILFVADKLSWDHSDAAPYLMEMRRSLDMSLEEAAKIYLTHVWDNRMQMKVVHPWLAEAYQELTNGA
ncbi:bis(5'-nucleosyl)-tetraphosphatase (symmetrical) YqeK [Paenibacillus nanensis]|nr:bis(5'-nucleosyl)-tetraphosphatase (symmetrical) YqeK [Paenibacillus nanensis]